MNTPFSRRRFLTAAAAAPLILPGRVRGLDGVPPPSGKVRLACIGVGGQGTGNSWAFLTDERVQVVAVCDVDANHRARAAAQAKLGEVEARKDWREVMARKDVACAADNPRRHDLQRHHHRTHPQRRRHQGLGEYQVGDGAVIGVTPGRVPPSSCRGSSPRR